MVHILKIPEYRFELLTGLVASAGGLTESLVKLVFSCALNNLLIFAMILGSSF
jgi:hypothetical protein